MDKKFHIALAVKDIEEAVRDYSQRLGAAPTLVAAGEYALWRTETLNFSIRKTQDAPGALRHVGWEDPAATGFAKETDVNGVVWERFSEKDQREEIQQLWPTAVSRETPR